jgi:hypothetical protein
VGANAIRARDTSNLKRAEQNGADERKDCEHGQHVDLQGKVHVAFSAFSGCPNLAERRRHSNDNYAAPPNLRARSSPSPAKVLI